jgi:maltooligosyltrehalose trehalohydrolase
LKTDKDGYFTGCFADIGAGTQYFYQLDDGKLYPDPCSRYQPEGPHGPSMVVDRDAMQWHDNEWQGVTIEKQIIYELHIGTFTPQGTFDAASEKLDHLQSLGITIIEVMPIAECPGRWNWGYDGVNMFAPNHHYGDYDALKRFVDRAHALNLGVILDVVYNHLGPDGNYLSRFSSYYFTKKYQTEWGDALNYDGEESQHVREFILQNACEWVREFHLDGLRLDATQSIFDSGKVHVLADLVRRTRSAAGPRSIIIVSENEPQHATHLLPADQGGFGLDAMWNDDFHHSAMVAATGKRHAYFTDYFGRPQEFVSGAKYGFLFQGQYYQWQKQPRGQRFESAPSANINFLQNHDQVANSLNGVRLHQQTSPARCRALTAVLLLGPQTPMLFMGQEFAATAPFLYFADHQGELGDAVCEGRYQFLTQFPGAATLEAKQVIARPGVDETFQLSKLNWQETQQHAAHLELHRDLIALRRRYWDREEVIDGAVLGEQAWLWRWSAANSNDRLLIINLGTEIPVQPLAEPMLVCARGMKWNLQWSSEQPKYGGSGVENPETNHGWYIPAECAVLLQAQFASN